MKRITIALIATTFVVTCGLSYGQSPSPNYEHLKVHEPYIGTWCYAGPLKEDIPGIATKGSKVVNHASWTWILDKNAIEVNWCNEYEGGTKVSGKGLIGWNAASERVIWGGMDSTGGHDVGVTTFEGEKKSTLRTEGIDGDGEKTSFAGVIWLTGKDTFEWQATERKGGDVEGPSPKYTFTRCECDDDDDDGDGDDDD